MLCYKPNRVAKEEDFFTITNVARKTGTGISPGFKSTIKERRLIPGDMAHAAGNAGLSIGGALQFIYADPMSETAV